MSEQTPDAAAFAAESGTEPTVLVSKPDNSGYVNTPPQADIKADRKFYTEDDLNKVRAQEKEKLYPQIDSLKEELASLKKEREEAAAAKAAKAKAEEEEELSLKELLARRTEEFEAQLNTEKQNLQEQLLTEKQEREKAFALLEREREFASLQAYKAQRIDEVRDNIIPELVDLISGNTKEEIESSIAALTERSSRILDSVQQASQDARRQMVGTRATLPATGPLDIETGSRQFTAEEIAAMSMNDYAKYRQQLLSPSAQGRSSGLFG